MSSCYRSRGVTSAAAAGGVITAQNWNVRPEQPAPILDRCFFYTPIDIWKLKTRFLSYIVYMRLGNNVLLGFILNVLLISIGGVELVVITRSVRSWVIAGYLISSDHGSPGRGPGNSWRRHSSSICLSVVPHQDEADRFFTRITLCQHFIKSICFVIYANLSTSLMTSSWSSGNYFT